MKTLTNDQPVDCFPKNPDANIYNFTDLNLTAMQKQIPYKTYNRIDIESQFQNLYDQLSDLKPSSDDNASWIKVKPVDIAHQSELWEQIHIQ